MLFDGHAYCFPSLKGARGFPNRGTFWRHLQQAMASHFQPSWRARDLTPADTSGLIDLSNWPSLDALKHANFRVARHGRFEWTVEDEDFFKQYFPPSVTDMSYLPESLVAEMDYAGVDMALLHRTPYLGIGNDFLASCVRRFPDRLKALAHVEEWLVEPDPEGSIQKLEKAVKERGLSGIQFLPPQLNLYGQGGPWDAPGFHPFWDALASLDIPVFFSIKERVDPRRESYLDEVKTLVRWMERYPDVTVVVTHGLNWRMFVEGDKINLPDEVWLPFENPNAHLQFLFPIGLGPVWDFPMPQVRPTIEECVKRIGADRLMWGTDMPIVMRFWTHTQNIDFIRKYCTFLGSQEMDAIMGGTTARLLGVGPLTGEGT